MTTLTVHIEDANQDAAVRTLLDALRVRYEELNVMDETEYLNSSPANKARLDQAIEEIKQGKGIEIDIDTLSPK